ncbi:uncharacterized protein CYBJADRAFT_13440 [Cyberlindnera jadinii NRRL Y-1542]|uniref:Uncharacterized protein n=1 Tax=Cyberlindnera jadinii (strain ATCC 18201 / CBS 1600 / BCRC 20928 / JCM 3617 / NBRC 0987 / NRRL Y-1542) TaxID=983966 RepID=A0A1E4SAI9_CYBJN|nr:hypothetical protein CYBJADRAFT_13440 [Cyberlindnera jadinii NRRL Y-1542]ODV76498.1 hypothetical protein CYBJADRAFT_13440 [Cyberlindnera jadinii NRRL Y-1542]
MDHLKLFIQQKSGCCRWYIRTLEGKVSKKDATVSCLYTNCVTYILIIHVNPERIQVAVRSPTTTVYMYNSINSTKCKVKLACTMYFFLCATMKFFHAPFGISFFHHGVLSFWFLRLKFWAKVRQCAFTINSLECKSCELWL